MLLSRPVAVSLADPSGGPVLAHSSMVLPCPAAPSGLLSGLHLPSFSTNLVSGADLQDAWVDQFTPGGQRVTHSSCSWMGRHLATFTCRPRSSLCTLTTASPQVAASGQVLAAASRSSPVSAPYSFRPLSHETLLWHHRLGHPSLPRLRGMASSTLNSGLPRSLPPLPLCSFCRGPAARRSSLFRGHERYFLLVVDDYSCYSIVFPLRRKGEVTEVLIDWIRGARRQLSESFGSDLPVLRLHSDKGGEFSSDLLRAFCRAEGICQTFMLPTSPQQNGIVERRIGMVMDVAHTSMIHAAAPHFLWPFAVQYAAHQINLQPRVSLPETTPTLRWTRKVGDASVLRVWGPRAFVRDASADKLSSRAVPCVFLGFPPDAPGLQFYHPTSRRVLSSQDVTFDESGPAPSGVSKVDPVDPVEVAVESGAARGAEPGVVGPGGGEPGVAEPERAESGGPPGVPSGREPLSLQRLREWYARRCSRAARATGPAAGGASGAGAAGGVAGAGAAGAAGVGGAGAGGTGTVGGRAGVGAAGGTGAAGVGGAACVGAVGAGAVATGGAAVAGAVGGTRAGGAVEVVAGDPGAEGTGVVSAVSGGAAQPRPYYVPLLQQVLALPPSTGPPPSLLIPPPIESPSQLQPASLLPGPSPYSGLTRGLTERREPESCPTSPARAHVPLPSPPASSLPALADLESDSLHTASPTVTRLLATVVTDPSLESNAASALVAEFVDFAAHCRLDYAASLVAESESASVCPPSVRGECALGTDVFEEKQEEFECFTAAVPHLVSMLLAPEGDPDALDIPTPRSYADAIEAFLQGSLHEEIWLRCPPGFTGSFPAGTQWSLRQPVYGLRQAPREWHDTLRTTLAALGFAPSTADPSLFLCTDATLPPFYVLVYVDNLVFATANTEALAHVKSELHKRHTCTDLAPPSDESVEPSGPYPELVGCLMSLMTCTQPDLAYPLSLLARYVAPGRHRKVHWDAAKRVLRYLCSTSSCEAEIYAGAMAAQELRWLTYLLTDLGEAPHSPPILYVDNKAMLALCQEHRQEHRTMHIALRYFLARQLQQRGQLCLAYVASQANTADVFTKALQPCDDQRFCTVLGLNACPCCCCYSPCCCRYSPCCCRSSPCYCSYSPAGAATALAAAATALAAAAAALAAAATALAAAAAGGGAAGSAGSAAGAGGAGGATGSAGGVADAGAARGGQKRSLPLPDDPTPQQLREWVLQRARPGGGGFGFLCTAQRRQESQQETFSPQVLSELFPQRCVTGSVEAAALGACESTAALGASESAAALGARASPATGPSSAEALHTFTLDTGASRCFFHDCTSLTPLAAPVPVSQAGPTGGPVVAQASTVLPCPAVPSGSLSGLHLPTFSTNLVSNAAIQDVWVDTFIPGGQRVVICTCSRTGRHLAMFTRRPGSSSYTLTTASAQVAAVGQVAASSQVSASSQLAASCSCRVLSHQTLLWHHRLGHPSLPRLRGMHSRLLVSGLPRSLPSLPRSPAPPCLPCVKGRQRAAPHSSEFPPTTAPLQTLHMDVWGPAPVGGTDQERYFPLVVEDYSRYTNVFPLWRKADVSGVLIPWIRATRCQLCERFSQDFPVLRLHSDRGGGFSSDLLAEFCRDEGIVQSFTLPASPRQNGIAKRRIGLIMEVVHTCMVHAATPHFLWPFAVRYAAHQLNLRPRVSEPETSPTLRWTGKVGDASVFRVDLPPLVEPLEVYPDSSGPAEGGDPAADDTVATRCSPRLETPPGLPPRPSSPPRSLLLWTLELRLLGAGSWGAATGGADSGGPVSPSGGGAVGSPGGGGHGPAGAGAAILGGTAGAGGTGGTASAGGAASAGGTRGATGAGGAGATSPRGATGAAGTGPTSPGGTASAGGAGGTAGARGAGAGGTRSAGPAGPGGARTGGAGAAGAGGTGGAAAAGAGGAAGVGGAGGAAGAADGGGAGAAGAGGAGAAGTTLRRPFFYPQPQSSLPPPDSQLPGSSLPVPAPHTEVIESLTERCEPKTRASTPVRARRVARPRPLAVPSTHGTALRPSSVPQRVVLPEPPASSLPHVLDPESDLARAASPTVTRLLATVVTDPYLESTAVFSLVTELVDFAARSRLDYVASLVTESESFCPPSVGGELALGSGVLKDRQFELKCFAAILPRFTSMLLCPEGDPDALDIPTPFSYAEPIAGEYSSQWQTAMDAEMASWKSTGTYVDEVPPPGANIVDGMWIFIVKRPPSSPPAFKARYVA
ncbi:unnamed protein product [Closterium sp. NIES-54]